MVLKNTIWILFFLLTACSMNAQARNYVVAKDGSGDFSSIQAAINAVPKNNTANFIILIKKGIYTEKLSIETPFIHLKGEDRENTILSFSIARDEFRCDHPDDWGVATLNVKANDISLENLTITNPYGFENTKEKTIDCPNDSTGKKLVRKDGHQMALRVIYATRLKANNCHFIAYGGDTVSPWEVDNGLWYFKDCIMEGGVDFYCPRGWAWAEHCVFISHSGPAAIWHDGSHVEDSKTVLVDCEFKGFDGFMLGRYHRDAQFYLINCRFAKNMRDSAIYLVPTSNVIQWGKRTYYYNCHREGGNDYTWYQNNLPAGLVPKDITVKWVFGDRWQPEKKRP